MGTNEFTDASSYKGKDIDSDGDGTVNDAETLQGQGPSDLGNTIDGSSITENAEGQIQVSKPSDVILGDFEQGLGDWQVVLGSHQGHISSRTTYADARTNVQPVRGKYLFTLETQYAGQGTIFLERDADLTDIDELSFFVGLMSTTTTYDDPTIHFEIDGTMEVDLRPNGSYAEKNARYFVDVSGMTGTHTLRFVIEDLRDGNNAYLEVDDISEIKNRREDFRGAGNQ